MRIAFKRISSDKSQRLKLATDLRLVTRHYVLATAVHAASLSTLSIGHMRAVMVTQLVEVF
jgi:hypothetical protein